MKVISGDGEDTNDINIGEGGIIGQGLRKHKEVCGANFLGRG